MERARRPGGDDTPDDLLAGGVGGLLVSVVGGAIPGADGALLGHLGCLLTLVSALTFGILWLDRRGPDDDGR